MLLCLAGIAQSDRPASGAGSDVTADEVLSGLREFYRRTARDDGSFTPGIEAGYRGISDSAYSDLAAVTYACTIHKTFGWELPHERKTIEFLLARQRDDGAFYNIAGTVDPDSAEGRCYNTTQALVALHALGVKPRRNPLAVLENIVKQDYEKLPAYATSFFPLAYLCCGQPIPDLVDRGIRSTMVQAGDGYLHDHVAATFHASHYYRLIGRPTPLADRIVRRVLRDQKPDGSWFINLASRDRHATFDAVFTLRQEGAGRDDCRQAIARAARWALTCRNADGGFGHYPGSTSDADANYFQAGTLVMAGWLKPAAKLPPDARLLSWGHLMPPPEETASQTAVAAEDSQRLPGWIGSVAFGPDGQSLAVAHADGTVEIVAAMNTDEVRAVLRHDQAVVSVAFSPDGKTIATGSFDHRARLWHAATGRQLRGLIGHRGAVMTVAFSPDGSLLATGSIDGDVRLWKAATGEPSGMLAGHQSWVNALAFSPDGKTLASASSDATLRLWDVDKCRQQKVIEADPAEIRSVAWSPDGKSLAAGIRYGAIKTWDTATWRERLNVKAHRGDVWSVAFTPDGRRLFTADGDWDGPGQIKIWSLASGREQSVMESPGEVLSLALAPDGKRLAWGGRDNRLFLRPLAEAGESGE